MIESLRSRWKKLALAGSTLLFLAVAAALIAARPVCAAAWSSGTDSAELADTIAVLLDVKPGATIVEAIHAARIRAAFNALGIKIPVVPSALISTSDRDVWVIKVDKVDKAA